MTGLRVLAVDDSRTIRALITITLQQAGMLVTTADDGQHGVTIIDAGLIPDLIITDINMPRLDGFGLIRAVRAKEALRAVPILVLTTESAPAMRERARAFGATGWITKPFHPDHLIRTIARVTSGGGA